MKENDPVNGLSREAAWRGGLSPEQARQLESWRATHPSEQDVWDEEVALTRILAELPDAAAPSNLTARVLNAVDRDGRQPQYALGDSWSIWLRRMGWVPRLGGVAVLVMAGFLGHHQYQSSKRAELARNVASVTELAGTVPSVEALMDLDVIRNLDSVGVPDEELLALYQ